MKTALLLFGLILAFPLFSADKPNALSVDEIKQLEVWVEVWNQYGKSIADQQAKLAALIDLQEETRKKIVSFSENAIKARGLAPEKYAVDFAAKEIKPLPEEPKKKEPPK